MDYNLEIKNIKEDIFGLIKKGEKRALSNGWVKPGYLDHTSNIWAWIFSEEFLARIDGGTHSGTTVLGQNYGTVLRWLEYGARILLNRNEPVNTQNSDDTRNHYNGLVKVKKELEEFIRL